MSGGTNLNDDRLRIAAFNRKTHDKTYVLYLQQGSNPYPYSTPISYSQRVKYTNVCCFKAVCSDPMGIESGFLNDRMISVSSSTFENFKSVDLSLDSDSAWVPFTASANQWIQVNDNNNNNNSSNG